MQHEKAKNAILWNSGEQLVLASKSGARRRILQQAAIPFIWDPANIDERSLESAYFACGGKIENLAGIIAQAKAIEVSRRYPGMLSLGADQVLSLDGQILHKAETVTGAFINLKRLSGRVHLLFSAFSIARDAMVIGEGVDSGKITMRSIDNRQMALYIRCAGAGVLESVGGYMLETIGIHLFEKVEGDNATILGLPILKVLPVLREQGALLL